MSRADSYAEGLRNIVVCSKLKSIDNFFVGDRICQIIICLRS